MSKRKKIGLNTKLATAFDVMIQIERAKTESEAILETLICLERLGYPNVMVSFLKTVNGERMLVPDPTLSVGEKWRGIARHTIRQYERSPDLVPIVLHQNRPRFVLDSRNDPDVDQELWRRFGLISQYVVPLATDSFRIGVMQVDMGTVSEKPEIECKMLDALAAHLSLAIERHRVFLEIERLNSQLVSDAKLIAFDAAAATIMHELMHSVGDYAATLRDALNKPSIRSNNDAFEFLKHTEKRVMNWVSSLTANVKAFRSNEIVEPFSVEVLLKEIVEMWHPKAALRGCAVTLRCQAKGKKISVRRSALTELFSCLLINSFEANARTIEIVVEHARERSTGEAVDSGVQIVVSDDGDGISPENSDLLKTLGWTTKGSQGHGMGLVVAKLLCRQMGGELRLVSCGKAAREPRTAFAVVLPVAE